MKNVPPPEARRCMKTGCGKTARWRPLLIYPSGAQGVLGLDLCDDCKATVKDASEIAPPKLETLKILGGPPELRWTEIDSELSKKLDGMRAS